MPKCPICGMPLSKRKKGGPAELPAGVLSRVQLSPYRVQLAGVETADITHRPLTRDVRAPGYVAVDETKLSRIVVRAAGYVEKLYVNESFADVTDGEPLAEIYSPELYSASQELLINQHDQPAKFGAAARTRLELVGRCAAGDRPDDQEGRSEPAARDPLFSRRTRVSEVSRRRRSRRARPGAIRAGRPVDRVGRR